MKKLSIAIFGLVFLLFGCESEKYKGSIENGEIALSEKRYDEAIYSFKIALDEKPNDEKAIEGLEKAEKELKKIAEEKKAAEETKKREEQQKREEEIKKKNAQNDISVFNIKEIAGKREVDVNKIFGNPSDTNINQIPFQGIMTEYKLNYYRDGKIEVMFVEDKAVNVRLNLTDNEFFRGKNLKKNLGYVGLPIVEIEEPKIKGQVSSFIHNVEGFYFVEVGEWRNVPGGFVFIVTEEKYKY